MGRIGVLSDRVMEHVPGTTRYYDDPERPQIATEYVEGLKYDESGHVRIILVPQPSDDPNDPLNWPLWRRDTILLVLSIVSVFATALGPILAANTLTLSLHYEKPFTEVALLTGYYLMGVGIAGIIYVPSARIWGKRHQFLWGTVLLIISSAWAGASENNYTSLLWARIFQGIATAPFEALVNAVVGDLYFVHERGKRMALTNLAVFGGAFFTPILVGKITHTIGWTWTFYLEAIFFGACFPCVVFFVPETAFRRSAHLNTDMAASDDVAMHKIDINTHELEHEPDSFPRNDLPGISTGHRLDSSVANTSSPQGTMPGGTVESNSTPLSGRTERFVDSHPPTKRSFAQSLKPFNGRYTDEGFIQLLVRPFMLFAHPAILWAMFIQGAMIGWTVFIGIILAAIFLGPPLFWDEVETGYAYTGAFIGAVVGFVIAGGLADWSARFMTRRNNGVYEPEFRILLVIPQLIFGCAGLYGFGVTSSHLTHYDFHWPIIFFGFEVMGMVIGAVASALYIVDAHREIAIEAFTCLLIFKNFFSFGLTFSAYNWLIQGGIYNTFMIISSIQVLICLLSVPMYIFGKRNRSYFHRHDIVKTSDAWVTAAVGERLAKDPTNPLKFVSKILVT